MAAERQAPDAILVQTNLTGAVTDIDEDPDSPDGNWLTTPGGDTPIVLRNSFGTPTGNPTAGAGLQEFKAWVRRTNNSATRIPTMTFEVYDDGSLHATIETDVDVNSTSGEMHSGTWDASGLSSADGSTVELRIVGTRSGGPAAQRNNVEIGAVEWNVDYAEVGGLGIPLVMHHRKQMAGN